jgi:peptidoglycan/LPS O-acetylase OafA/YrhL
MMLAKQSAGKEELSASSPRPKSGYLPTLDGWRAIAILAVIFFHDKLYSIGAFSDGWLYRNGSTGVDLFFAISGLLICSRLLEEEQAFGRISLRNFYVRRAFRILPPALAYMGVIALLSLAGVVHIGLREWFGSLFFFRNYTSLIGGLGKDSIFLEHYWSLAVEEHFYLILPAVLVLTRKRWRLPALIFIGLVTEIDRMHALQTRPWILIDHHTDVRLDYLLIPAIFAVVLQSGVVKVKLRKWLRIWPLIFTFTLVLITFWSGSFWQTTALAFSLPLTILGSVLNPHGFMARVLEWSPFRFIGRISYSLYLWQELFFTGHFYTGGYPLGILQSTSLRFVAAFALSLASYYLLERPLIRLGHKMAPPATPGREDMPAAIPDGEVHPVQATVVSSSEL